MTAPTSRRDFLLFKGDSSDRPGGAIVGAESEGSTSKADHYLLHVGRKAMACEFEVFLNAGQYAEGMEQALATLDLVDQIESQLSVFRESSELCQVNRTAAALPVAVEADLFGILKLALALYEQTGGAYDITSTPLWETWGFARRAGRMPSEAEIADAMKCVGSRHVQLDESAQTVHFREWGVRLNLGSMGKGYALDRCAGQLEESGIVDFLVHGGGSSVVARGADFSTRGAGGSGDGCWVVGIRHPLRPDRRLGEIRLRNRAIGTSGSQAQSFWHQGRRYGHIIDPRTGQPAQGVFSATVVAPTGILADALSTAFYVMGPEATLEFCSRRPELGVVLVVPARRPGGYEVRTAGLGADELRLFG